jgi:hypothetical protein
LHPQKVCLFLTERANVSLLCLRKILGGQREKGTSAGAEITPEASQKNSLRNHFLGNAVGTLERKAP